MMKRRCHELEVSLVLLGKLGWFVKARERKKVVVNTSAATVPRASRDGATTFDSGSKDFRETALAELLFLRARASGIQSTRPSTENVASGKVMADTDEVRIQAEGNLGRGQRGPITLTLLLPYLRYIRNARQRQHHHPTTGSYVLRGGNKRHLRSAECKLKEESVFPHPPRGPASHGEALLQAYGLTAPRSLRTRPSWASCTGKASATNDHKWRRPTPSLAVVEAEHGGDWWGRCNVGWL